MVVQDGSAAGGGGAHLADRGAGEAVAAELSSDNGGGGGKGETGPCQPGLNARLQRRLRLRVGRVHQRRRGCLLLLARSPRRSHRAAAAEGGGGHAPAVRERQAYPTLVATHLFNSFAMLSANTAVFSLLFLVFNGADLLGFTSHTATLALSTAGAIVYSVVIGITTVVCNLVVLVAAMERCAGHAALLGACVQNG
ncbi:hypothetical protein GUJ93_ZPchr0002g24139 [Zizania palustris]|uniref:Uncharacterized protein n=1 Tax=Zizania palustris TaxID=103762 RepID=A0A8J5V9S1_ZIZPA|nr:hypothetical protein GUJ93_ZPchr0002g24139 [Zizania palustris]